MTRISIGTTKAITYGMPTTRRNSNDSRRASRIGRLSGRGWAVSRHNGSDAPVGS